MPITPCRAVDTRVAGGRIASGSSRGFDVFGTSSFADQGGGTGGCGVPAFASAVAINLISTQPTGTGYLRGSRQNTGGTPTAPEATLLSFATGPNRSNEVPVQTCRDFFLSVCVGSDEIRIFSFQSATHVVIDILGYYVEPTMATVDGDPDPPVIRRSAGLSFFPLTHNGTGIWTVNTERDLRGCAIQVTTGNSNEEGAGAVVSIVSSVSSTGFTVYQLDLDGFLIDDDWSFSATC